MVKAITSNTHNNSDVSDLQYEQKLIWNPTVIFLLVRLNKEQRNSHRIVDLIDNKIKQMIY